MIHHSPVGSSSTREAFNGFADRARSHRGEGSSIIQRPDRALESDT
jgi:hypothetical protein